MSPATTKRPLVDDLHNAQPPSAKRANAMSFAANLNAKTLRKIQEAFKADPEVDFTEVLPKNYSSQLARRLADKGKQLRPSSNRC